MCNHTPISIVRKVTAVLTALSLCVLSQPTLASESTGGSDGTDQRVASRLDVDHSPFLNFAIFSRTCFSVYPHFLSKQT